MAKRPHLILINCDDLGYGDLGCYGSTVNRTPAIDRMAAEGLRLTSFYQASALCSPSRGAMLTGCYPNRISFGSFDGFPVLFPGHAVGLNPAERTIASQLRAAGYRTMLVGKWHVGDQPEFFPDRHGFEHWFGLPYSNDMGRQRGDRSAWIRRLQGALGVSYRGEGCEPDHEYPPLPLMQDGRVVQEQPDQAALTERYVHEAVSFIRRSAASDAPFFLYFAHMYVHQPLYVPQPYLDRSRNGRYGAAVEHVDWSVAVLLDELKRLGIDDNTLVVFTSDNGSRVHGEGGSNAPLRGTKMQTWEGGQRVPCIVRWPGVVPAGTVSDAITSGIDLLPTLLRSAGVRPATDRVIDGVDCGAHWRAPQGPGPRDTFCYFHQGTLEAIRHGRWKLHLWRAGTALSALYDLDADIGETIDRSAEHPAVVERLRALAQHWRAELGDAAHGITGTAVRPAGRVARADTLTHVDPSHPYFLAEYDLAESG
jgi:arylsulfatase A